MPCKQIKQFVRKQKRRTANLKLSQPYAHS
jgi:hypothetical protein